jgi:hypothetical protein
MKSSRADSHMRQFTYITVSVMVYLNYLTWLSAREDFVGLRNSACCLHSICVCLVWLSQETAAFVPTQYYLVFITEMECVYCAVRADPFKYNSVNIHQCSILIFIYMLLLPGRQTGEAWEPSKKQCSAFAEIAEHWIPSLFLHV